MGICISKKASPNAPPIGMSLSRKEESISMRSFLDRSDQCIYAIVNNKLTKRRFSRKIKARKDSAVSLLPNDRIIFGGGTTSTGCLSSEVYLLNSSTLNCLPEMPLTVKHGAFFEHTNYIYYVGGVTMPDNEDSNSVEVPAPLIRYNQLTSSWEVIRTAKKSLNSVHASMSGNVNESLGDIRAFFLENEEISPENILYPGVCQSEHKIYFLGGFILDESAQLVKNTKVFSLTLGKDLLFECEDLSIPVHLLKPLCTYSQGKIFIVGGLDSDWNSLSSVYSINIKLPQHAKELQKLSSLSENYLVEYDGTLVVASLPFIRKYTEFGWHTIDTSEMPVEQKGAIAVVASKEANESKVMDLDLSIVSPFKSPIPTNNSKSFARNLGTSDDNALEIDSPVKWKESSPSSESAKSAKKINNPFIDLFKTDKIVAPGGKVTAKKKIQEVNHSISSEEFNKIPEFPHIKEQEYQVIKSQPTFLNFQPSEPDLNDECNKTENRKLKDHFIPILGRPKDQEAIFGRSDSSSHSVEQVGTVIEKSSISSGEF